MHFHLHSVLRVFLAWLLALAIPLQGMAATGALACAGHRAAVQVAAADAAMPAGHGHAMHAGHGMPADVGMHAAQQADHADPAQHAHHGHDVQPSDKHACSACAACCVGGMLPVRAFSLERADVAGARAVAVPDTFHPGIVPPRLERPPRAA